MARLASIITVLTSTIVVAFAAAQSPDEDLRSYSGQSEYSGHAAEQTEEMAAFEQEVNALERRARSMFPESYAGLWIGEIGDGKGVLPGEFADIHLAFSRDALESAALLTKEFSRPDLIVAESVEHSYAELITVMRSIAEERKEGGPIPADSATDIALEQNRVLVFRARPGEALESYLDSQYDGAATIEVSGDPQLQTCNIRSSCKPNLRSGVTVGKAGVDVNCTAAFVVEGSFSGRHILSAGHCSGSNRSHNGELFGEVRDQSFGGRVDAERIDIDSPFNGVPRIFIDQNETAREVKSEGSYSDLQVGQAVCQSGAASGMSCGEVKGVLFQPVPAIPNGNHFIRTDYCAANTDSGAGVFIVGRALGIHSGNSSGVNCNQNGYYSFFGHIEFAKDALDFTISKAP